MIELLAASFAIGFLGSFHCVGMCGGLITAMAMTRSRTWWPGVIVYQFGRITTYAIMGLIAGVIGGLLTQGSWLSEVQNILSIAAGLLIIVFALHIGGWLPDPFAKLSTRIANATGLSRSISAAATQDSATPWLTVGLLNGLLPCGLVYAAISLSLTASTSVLGAATMLSFGLGTVPAMIAAPVLMRSLAPEIRGRVLKFGAIILILIGVFTIVRGTALGQHKHNGHDGQHHSMQQQTMSSDPVNYCTIKTPQ
jgi:sulfite exporter TauE/SafE